MPLPIIDPTTMAVRAASPRPGRTVADCAGGAVTSAADMCDLRSRVRGVKRKLTAPVSGVVGSVIITAPLVIDRLKSDHSPMQYARLPEQTVELPHWNGYHPAATLTRSASLKPTTLKAVVANVVIVLPAGI